jgi:mannan endo-1,4-beta-mannosidase
MLVMRATSLAAALTGLLASCGESLPPPDVLEAQAADCSPSPLLAIDGRPHVVALNAYYLQEQAARAVRRGESSCGELEETLRKARSLGVTVLRTLGFNDGADKRGDSAIQIDRLIYDEIALRGLDLVLARAAVYGVQLVLPLGNYWDDYGGARQYAAWAGLADPVEGDPRFFTERRVIDHYKAHVARLLDRVNTVDGQRTGDHPAVLVWELLNEPRSRGLDDGGVALRAWVDEVGAWIKARTSRPLGTGEEGFDWSPEGYDAAFWDEVAPALLRRAGHFRALLASPAVDVASIHFFPEAWGVPPGRTAAVGARWLSEHAAVARQLGKPLLLGELGLRNDGVFTLEERRAMIRGWLRCARDSGLGGAALWMFANDARPDAWDRHTFYFRDGTTPDDPRNRYADIVAGAAR